MNYNTLKRFFDRAIHKYSVLYPITRTTKHLPRQFFYQELVEIAPPQGAIVECGVAHGDGLVTFAALQPSRKIYGFDSFQGFPEPSVFDHSFRNPLKGQYGECTLSYVQKVLANAGARNVQLIKGYVEDTAPRFLPEIGLLYIDLDLYGGYKAVLENMYKNVVRGGVVAFDEYNEPKWPGAKKAVDDFLSENPHELHKSKYCNRFYIIKS